MSYTPTTPEGYIYEALCVRLQSLVLSPVTPIQWPNLDFTPPEDRRYLRVQYLPNESERYLIDSDGPHRHVGIFQVTVVLQLQDGILRARDVASAVASHFSADTRMSYGGVVVRSMKRPSVAVSMNDGADLLTPVSVEYESYI